MNVTNQPSCKERQDPIATARRKYADENIEIDDNAEISET